MGISVASRIDLTLVLGNCFAKCVGIVSHIISFAGQIFISSSLSFSFLVQKVNPGCYNLPHCMLSLIIQTYQRFHESQEELVDR